MDDMLINPRRRVAANPVEVDKALILNMTTTLLDCPKSGSLQDAFNHYVSECVRYAARPPPVTCPKIDASPVLLPKKAVSICFKKNIEIKHAKKEDPS